MQREEQLFVFGIYSELSQNNLRLLKSKKLAVASVWSYILNWSSGVCSYNTRLISHLFCGLRVLKIRSDLTITKCAPDIYIYNISIYIYIYNVTRACGETAAAKWVCCSLWLRHIQVPKGAMSLKIQITSLLQLWTDKTMSLCTVLKKTMNFWYNREQKCSTWLNEEKEILECVASPFKRMVRAAQTVHSFSSFLKNDFIIIALRLAVFKVVPSLIYFYKQNVSKRFPFLQITPCIQ